MHSHRRKLCQSNRPARALEACLSKANPSLPGLWKGPSGWLLPLLMQAARAALCPCIDIQKGVTLLSQKESQLALQHWLACICLKHTAQVWHRGLLETMTFS